MVNPADSLLPGLTPAPRRGGSTPVLGVDIDETISWTVGYWFERLLKDFPIEGSPTAEALIAEYRFAQNVPGWKTEAALARMQEYRVSHEVHLELPIVPGSPEALQRLARVFDIEYVTMRNPLVERATAMWLQACGFPAGTLTISPPDLDHHLKPVWKGNLLAQRHPELVGIVEDHPDVVRSIPAGYQGTVFLIGHTESPRNDIRVIPCADWKDVEFAVNREMPRLLGIPRAPT